MFLGHLLKSAKKNHKRIPVKGISFDSRKIKKGDIFFAIKGKKNSGINFINNNLIKKASAIVCEKKFNNYKNLKIPVILAKDVRQCLSEACSNFFTKKPKKLIAVTGTNGKSSVANFFYQILDFNKIPVASIGTLGIHCKNYRKKTNLTSLDPLEIHKNLDLLSRRKINHVILEASSHGLDQKRLDYLNIDTGIFTNLSHDHLDYHKNMKSYFNAKIYLFSNLLKEKSKVITDEDIKEFKIINKVLERRRLKKITIGSASGNIRVLGVRYKGDKQVVRVSVNYKNYTLTVPLIGFFQVKNLLMAILSASLYGINKNKIFNQIKKIKPVPGRLESIGNLKNNSYIILDFAHTPDALEKSLIAITKQFKKKIILVMGCGGDRDKKKRIIMGKIAKKYCNKVFVTDDNPRNENPEKIRKTIMKGCKGIAINIGNRKKAIGTAINKLKSNEILLVAGKGHEDTQDYGKKIINFSDKKVIKEMIKKRKKILLKKRDYWSEFIAEKTFNKNRLKKINYKGVSINTKTLKKNDLFFAVQGKNNDGHKFIKEAISKGATRCVISKNIKLLSRNKTIKVNNTLSTLNDLARVTRNNTIAQIIGITGSVGKTTLKNLISFALKNYGSIYQSPYSYNNKYGVPLSIANLKQNTDFGIFEIGMDKKGEIQNLSKLVKPNLAIITNISEAHLKNFNNVKDIAKAKAEIINNITEGGSIILNKDGKFYDFLSNQAQNKKINVISFSAKKKADISLIKIIKLKNNYRIKVLVNSKIFYFNIKNSTKSFINNVLACISTLHVLDLDLRRIERKLIHFITPEGRGDVRIVKKFNKRFKFIDESYNANPLSMKSAINNMSYYKRKGNSQKLVLLGDMLELGQNSEKLHRDLSRFLNKSDIDKVYVCGKHIKKTYDFLHTNKKGKIFNNLNEAYNQFSKILHNNDILMVKGSNATGLNKFSKNIKRGQLSVI